MIETMVKLESEIAQRLKGVTTHFIYDQSLGAETKLDIITFNPRHNEMFLYHTVLEEGTKTSCLLKALEDIKSFEKEKSLATYTIRWSKRKEGEHYESYFSAKNEEDALKKFYYGKDRDNIILYNLKLNPIA